MDRRDRSRYDRDRYDRDYSGGTGYSANDEHYHSARNLTNEFEQHYRSRHPEEERESRRNREYDYDRYDRDRSSRESDYGYRSSRDHRQADADRNRQRSSGAYGNQRSSDYGQSAGDGSRDRNTYGSVYRIPDSDPYGSYGRQDSDNRYSRRHEDDARYSSSGNSYGHQRNRYGNSDRERASKERAENEWARYMDSRFVGSRFSDEEKDDDRERYNRQRGGDRDRTREGYGISDYDSMRGSSVRSNRGVPNQGITSSFTDDYGTDFESERRHGLSSGNFGGYGAHSGDYRRHRDDR